MPVAKDGVDDVIGAALRDELVLEPTLEEFQHGRFCFIGGALQPRSEDGEALIDQGTQ